MMPPMDDRIPPTTRPPPPTRRPRPRPHARTAPPFRRSVTLTGRLVRLEPLSLDHVPRSLRSGWSPRSGAGPATGRLTSGLRAYVERALEAAAEGREVPFVQVERATGRPIGSTRFLNIARRTGAWRSGTRGSGARGGARASTPMPSGRCSSTRSTTSAPIASSSRPMRSTAAHARRSARSARPRRASSAAPPDLRRSGARLRVLLGGLGRVAAGPRAPRSAGRIADDQGRLRPLGHGSTVGSHGRRCRTSAPPRVHPHLPSSGAQDPRPPSRRPDGRFHRPNRDHRRRAVGRGRSSPRITFDYGEDWWKLAAVAILFGVINSLIKPVIKLLALPIRLATLGLVTFLINGAMLLLLAWVSEQLAFDFHDRRLPADARLSTRSWGPSSARSSCRSCRRSSGSSTSGGGSSPSRGRGHARAARRARPPRRDRVRPPAGRSSVRTPAFVTDVATLTGGDRRPGGRVPRSWIRQFSLKANDVTAIVARIGEAGLGANVVSHGEWEVARRAGIADERITLEGAGKSDRDLAAAVRAARARPSAALGSGGVDGRARRARRRRPRRPGWAGDGGRRSTS